MTSGFGIHTTTKGTVSAQTEPNRAVKPWLNSLLVPKNLMVWLCDKPKLSLLAQTHRDIDTDRDPAMACRVPSSQLQYAILASIMFFAFFTRLLVSLHPYSGNPSLPPSLSTPISLDWKLRCLKENDKFFFCALLFPVDGANRYFRLRKERLCSNLTVCCLWPLLVEHT